jgi:hypothetical protein
MRRFRMRRNRVANRLALFTPESFEKTKFENKTYDDNEIEYRFQTTDGSSYYVTITHEQEEYGNCFYYMEFELEGPDYGYGIVGDKQAFEVMNHIVSLIDRLFKFYHEFIKYLAFSASSNEVSRIKLYEKMLKRFGLEFEKQYQADDGFVTYVVKNPHYKGECYWEVDEDEEDSEY